MIIRSYSNIDIIQGIIGYGNATEGITDWRITNTNSGVFNILNSSSIITPSGGTSEIGEIPGTTDRYMIFTAGTSTFTVPSGGIKCDILVVGGGGGGGSDRGGGGGAGGLVFQTGIILNGTINVLVGSGGIASITDTTTGGNGGSSSIGSIIALGGGGGGSEQSNANNGGSGGGSAYSYLLSHFGTGDQPTSSSGGYGNRGGDARDLTQTTANRGCGGGGGAGTRGLEATSVVGGAGGDGLAGVGNIDFKTHFNLPTNNTVGHYISGENKVYFAGGGGGGDCVDDTSNPSPHGLGGKGGGANGNTSANIRGTALTNSGGGGGGGRADGQLPIGSNGSSGIVIIRYSTANISIIDNGNVGIGITPTTNSSLLEIGGNVNITGIYKKNNRNVVSDTSNYILTTSNLLVNRIVNEVRFGSNYTNRINTELNTKINDTSNYVLTTINQFANSVSSQWTSVNSGIYYTKANSAITSTPQPLLITNELGTIRTMVFTYTTETAGAGTGQTLYTINVPTNITCDILVIGGGGGGGSGIGSGGGAGGLLYYTGVNIAAGTYTIIVGAGGTGAVNYLARGANGNNSSAFGNIAYGGGGGAGQSWVYNNYGTASGTLQTTSANQGSGAGGTRYKTLGNAGTAGQGYSGGNHIDGGNIYSSGGGGGAGGVGGDGSLTSQGGIGGIGVSCSITGTSIDYAGGGGGVKDNYNTTPSTFTGSSASYGGGAGGVPTGANGTDGKGGGGGAGGGESAPRGGNGGSGIVIIRFVIPTGNVGIGTTNPISKLHVFDDTTNNTTLTIQNNYTEPVSIFPSTGYALTETIENNIYYRTLTFTYSLLKNYPIIPPIPGNPANTTLLAWYKFNGDGLDYNTSATKYNLIANTGNPTYSSGTTEGSFFQGFRYMNGSISTMVNSSLQLSNRAFSISVWIRPLSSLSNIFIQQGSEPTTRLMIGYGRSGINNSNIVYILSVNNVNLLAYGASSSGYLQTNLWVHIVYVVEANYNKKIYRNGVLEASNTSTTTFTEIGNLIIASGFDSTGGTADISDLRIYTTGLSATDVATLYGSYTPLLAWYRFDGDGLDYNPYATKFNLIANTGTPTYSSGTTVDSFLQGRRYINTSTGSLKNTTLSLNSRAFSIAVWYRPKKAESYFIEQNTAINTTNAGLIFGYSADKGHIMSFYYNYITSPPYPDDMNNWVHIVCVVLPNYNRRMYRNGVLVASDTNTSSYNGTGDFRVGINFIGMVNENIDFSDLRIYTVGLSATDVATLYASYSNIVTSDNYSVNFANTSKVFVNGSSKTVNGIYGIYTGETNSSMLPLSNQSDIPLATTTSTGTSSVVVKYAYNQNILPPIISGTGITSTIVGNTSVCSIFTYTGTPATNANTTYTFTTTEPYLCDILIIGGGGAGGDSMGGGGGAGGVVYAINQLLPASTYKVNVGRGGIGGSTAEEQGTAGIEQDGTESSLMNSNGTSYISLTLGGVSQQLRGLGGGGGGVYYNASFLNGRSGGSGGGCTENNPGFGLNTPGTATQPATYWNGSSYIVGGKAGRQNTTTTQDYQAGGGGGLGDVSSDYRNGNSGVSINITGTSRFYAAGGGAGQYIGASTTAGLGGSFVGGNGRVWNGSAYAAAPRDVATSGTNSTGSGGGGTAYSQAPVSIAGSGGSGVVIIRYRKLTSSSFELINVENNIINREPIIPGTTVVAIPGTLFKYILFPYTITTSGLTGQTQYTFTATEDINCEILVVAGGGGGGGSIGGGGGAGAVVYIPSATLSAGSYTIRVGNGGIGSTGGASANGNISSISGSFGTITAEGGGGVTGGYSEGDGNIGGSGGGAAGNQSVLNYGGAAGTSSSLGGFTGFIYGNRGGNNTTTRTANPTNASGGGGAGSAAADTNVNGAAGGNGGAGILITITGNNVYYGGGGGGAGHVADRGAGGIGGGGDGAREDKVGYPGAPNTGGGGGGGGWQGNSGGSGGSGVVIIKYLITKNLTTNYKIGNYNGDFKIISSVSSSVSSTQSSTFSSSDIDYMRITGNGASIYNPTGSPQWSTVSDRRIKENIEKASYDKCYNNINNLELYRFNYIKELNNINKDIKQLGYIAQEVENIFPKAVSSQSFNNNSLSIPNLLSIDISQINYSLYGTVKKLIELDKNKEARIKKMEYLLNIDTPPIITSNITVDISTESNIVIDITTTTSNNFNLYTSNNFTFDTQVLNNFSFYKPPIINLTIETLDTTTETSNLIIDILDTTTETSNLTIEILDTATSNLTIEILDTATSNLTIETLDTTIATSNLIIDILDTKATSNISIE